MKWRAYKRTARRLAEDYRAATLRPINVRCFLPPMDGEHNDAPAMQAAVDFVAKYGGGSIGLPGTMTITGGRVVGRGSTRSVFMHEEEDERA